MGDAGSETPHDTLFRQTFSQPENAAVELRAVLPPALLARLELSSLRVVSGTFAEPGEPNLHSDMLYEVDLSGRHAYVYVVLEHQSTVDRWMALRLLGYVTRILERHRRHFPELEFLPAVIPLVLHHSRSWMP